MYLFLPHVITTYSGKTFQEFVTERIFVPLNMTATTYNLTAADDSGLMSQSFIFTGRRIPIIFQDPTAANFIAGAGGVISNAVDMVRQLRAGPGVLAMLTIGRDCRRSGRRPS